MMVDVLKALLLAFAAVAVVTSEASIIGGGRRWWDPTSKNAPKFRGTQFYNIDASVEVSQIPGHIAAFGDFDSDRFTDIFVVDPDRRRLSVFLWSPKSWSFSSTAVVNFTAHFPIVNVALNDVNYDGLLDAVVMTRDVVTNSKFLTIHVVCNVKGESFRTTNITTIDTVFTDQPLLLDWDGDMRTDLLGPSVNGTTAVLLNTGDDRMYNKQSPIFPAGLPKLTVPHSASFLDLDGDCHADLFLSAAPAKDKIETTYDVWLWRNGTFAPSLSYEAPDGAGQVTFADFDRDGAVDFAVPVCYPPGTCAKVNSVVLVRNVQIAMCGTGASKCRKMTALCAADPDFHFADGFSTANSTVAGVTVIPKSVFDSYNVRMFTPDASEVPLVLRVGDYNLDGYPDILVPTVDAVTGAKTVQLWESYQCNSTLCPELAESECKAQRTFRPVTTNVDVLAAIHGAYTAAFFDFGENGMLGAFVMYDPAHDDNATAGAFKRFHALYNNFQPDAFFVKATGLNGVCTEWCSTGAKFPDPKPYGAGYPGGTWKFSLTDTDGSTIGAQGVQSYQSAYSPLLTPYVMFGLGRVSNYLETVFYGVAAHQSSSWYNYWQGIIPNSQLVAIPYKINNPTYWTLELFLAPSGIAFWVIIAVFGTLLTIGGTLVFFKCREMKEDKRRKEDVRHLFDFNAL